MTGAVPEEVRISSRNGGVRGNYIRIHDALPAGIEDPAYEERPSADPDKYYLFRSKGRWHLNEELAVNEKVLCSTDLTDEPDPTKIPTHPADSSWSKNVTKIEPCGDSVDATISRLELHSKFSNLHDGLRRRGDELLWASDDDKLFLWKEEHEDEWRVTAGPPGSTAALQLLAKARARGSNDPRKAAWKESGDRITSITEVWWDETAKYDEGLWRDPAFPPNEKSLGSAAKEIGDVEWIPGRALDRDPSNDVLFDNIEASDLVQGTLGDCWLIAAVAAVAEFPNIIEELFLEGRSQLPADGKHEIKLYDVVKGHWEVIVVDEFIPCKPRKWHELDAVPLFSQPVGHELWVLLLEKAFAKMFGGYGNLKGGRPVFAWQALTGVRDQRVFCRSDAGLWEEFSLDVEEQVAERRRGRPNALPLVRGEDDPSYSNSEFWKYLRKWGGSHVLAAMIDSGSDDALPNGLIPGHAYSLIRVKETAGFHLVQLRNPMGAIEWNGAWSDDDKLWKEHPNVAEEVDYCVADDGTFWMCFEDFVNEFNTVSLCPHKLDNAFARRMTSCAHNADDSVRRTLYSARFEMQGDEEEEESDRCSDRCTNKCSVM